MKFCFLFSFVVTGFYTRIFYSNSLTWLLLFLFSIDWGAIHVLLGVFSLYVEVGRIGVHAFL